MFIEIPVNNHAKQMRKPIFGVGITDVEYQVQPLIDGKRQRCPYYRVWFDMLKRCYSSKYQEKQPTYTGCTVCTEWLLFSNFRKWMELQDWEGKQLDKDLLIQGNKLYAPETCIFVTHAINSLLTNCVVLKGKYVKGVSYDRVRNKYNAQCCINGKKKNLGYYLSELEAEEVYKACKKQVIVNIAYSQKDLKIQEALLKIASQY